MRLLLLLCAAALLLLSCQPLPHPFAESAPPAGSPILTPRDGAGIAVDRVDGVSQPLGAALAAAMATALQNSDVPASADASNKVSYQLLGTASETSAAGGQVLVDLRWELRDHEGATVGTHRQTVEAAAALWHDGDPKLLARVAKGAAPPIADLLQEKGTVAVARTAPEVVVSPVSGAPGDGSRTLARALRDVLRRARVAVAEGDKATGTSFTVDGSVALTAAGAGKQKVQITWVLIDPKGAKVGQVKQENAVAAGSLDGPWGAVAYAVAEAAADGIIALLDRAKASSAAS
jgi:hypothetical protein